MKLLKWTSFLSYTFLLFGCASGGSSSAVSNVIKSNSAEVTERKNTDEQLTPRNYAAWVENKENGLKVEKTVGELTYMLQYKPLEYVAILDLRKDSIRKEELAKKIEEYSNLQYFTFKISADSRTELLKKDLKERTDYYSRIQYFSFDMQQDLKLIDGKDTLNCVLFHFERVYGIAPEATFVIGFPKTKNDHDKTLCYDEKVFGSGKIYLTIQSKNNNHLPAVITY